MSFAYPYFQEGISEPSYPKIRLAAMNHLVVFRTVASTGLSQGLYDISYAKRLRSSLALHSSLQNPSMLIDSLCLLAISPLVGQGAGKKMRSLLFRKLSLVGKT